MKQERGFTMIELLIVLAILGVLTSFILPGFIQQLQQSKATTCIIFRQNIQTAADYYIKVNRFQPGDTLPSIATLVDENLLPGVDKCPSGGVYLWADPVFHGTATPFLVNCSVHFLVGM